MKCLTCLSEGFARSVLGPDRCEFCDGTFSGNPPTEEEIQESRKIADPKPPSIGPACDRCDGTSGDMEENDYGELLCSSCTDTLAEAAWERYCEAFHDGGSTQFKSLLEQQIEARKLK